MRQVHEDYVRICRRRRRCCFCRVVGGDGVHRQVRAIRSKILRI